MPPASSSLLYTWSFESILMGLGVLTVANYPIELFASWSLLALSSLSAILHIAAAAGDVDWHHEISVSYLSVISGVALSMLYAGLDPVLGPQLWGGSDIRRVVTLSVSLVVVLVAIALTMSSCEGATPLFFHKISHSALVWPLALVILGLKSCIHFWILLCISFAGVGVLLILGALGWVLEYHLVSFILSLALFLWQLIFGGGWSLTLIYSLVLAAIGFAWLVWSAVSAGYEWSITPTVAIPLPLPTPTAPPEPHPPSLPLPTPQSSVGAHLRLSDTSFRLPDGFGRGRLKMM